MRTKRIKLRREQNFLFGVYLRECACLIVCVYTSSVDMYMRMCRNYISTVCVGICD